MNIGKEHQTVKPSVVEWGLHRVYVRYVFCVVTEDKFLLVWRSFTPVRSSVEQYKSCPSKRPIKTNFYVYKCKNKYKSRYI